jgi:DNA-binding beta-propeller fold protein YncE
MMPQQRVALSKVGSGILIAIASVLPSIAIAQAPNRGAPPVLRTVAEIPLTGPAVRFDYQTLDTLSNRLYIAHMDADQLVVVDLAKRAVVATLNGFDRVHGVIVAPDIGRVYASATGRHEVMAVDVRSLALVAHIGPITYPNGLAYAPDVQRVFVSDNAGTEAVIDAKSNRLITSIQLGAGAGNTVYDPVTRRILVARHRENDLVAIDPATATIIGRVALPGIGNSHGVVLDAARRLAFVAGTANATLGVVDLDSMRLTHTYRVARSPDVLAFDPGWRRVYVSSESGGVTVLREIDTPNGIALRHEGDLAMPHAHTVAVDPRTHLVYFPLHEVNGRPVLRIMVGQPPP